MAASSLHGAPAATSLPLQATRCAHGRWVLPYKRMQAVQRMRGSHAACSSRMLRACAMRATLHPMQTLPAPMRSPMQRAVVIYDRNGRLVEELALPAAEAVVIGIDPKASCCSALQVRCAPGRMQRSSLPCRAAPCGVVKDNTDLTNCCTLKACTHLRSPLQWDAAGDMLAALPTGSSTVFVWAAASREVQKLETEFRVRWATSLREPEAVTCSRTACSFSLVCLNKACNATNRPKS